MMAIIKYILDVLRRLLRLPFIFIEKHPGWFFFFLVVFFTYFSVDWDGENDFTWKEEVQLSNGERVWVERYAYLKKFGWVATPRGIEIKKMSLKIIGDDESYPREWRYRFAPLLLDKDPETKQWFIIATWYRSDKHVRRLGLSKPTYWYIRFDYKNGFWEPSHLTKDFVDQRKKSNLIGSVKYSGEGKFTVETKKKRLISQITGHYCITDVPNAFNLKKYCESKR